MKTDLVEESKDLPLEDLSVMEPKERKQILEARIRLYMAQLRDLDLDGDKEVDPDELLGHNSQGQRKFDPFNVG